LALELFLFVLTISTFTQKSMEPDQWIGLTGIGMPSNNLYLPFITGGVAPSSWYSFLKN